MQVVPDYTPQLKRIADALNRPSTPQWVFVVVGAGLTLIIQFGLKWYDVWSKRRKMRKIVYSELLSMYHVISDLEDVPFVEYPPDHREWQLAQLKGRINFHGEEYYKKDMDTFADLSERYYIETLYYRYHCVFDERTDFNINLQLTRDLTASFFAEKNLSNRWLKLSAGEYYDDLIDDFRRTHEDRQCGVRRIMVEEQARENDEV